MKFLKLSLCLWLAFAQCVDAATVRIAGATLAVEDAGGGGIDLWVPELPQLTVDTTLPTGWDGTADATPADSAAFQTALDNAVQNGDGMYIIQLTAGATYTGPFKARAKAGTGWIIVRTSGYASLPAVGTRVTSAANMAKITGTGTGAQSCGLWHEWGADHIRYIGIEFTTTHTTTSGTATIVNVGYDPDANAHPDEISEQNSYIIFDRCYVHGNSTGNSRQGIQFDCSYGAVIDSRIDNIHETGADNQAIWIYQGAGPYKIDNNYLSASCENMMIGGEDPAIANMVPADITVTRNYFFKSLTWKPDDASYAGTAWSVKNLFELKNARRVLIEGNILVNSWKSGQNGWAFVFTPRNQSGSAPWCTVEDVTCRLNQVNNVSSGIQILSADTNSGNVTRMLIENNVINCDQTANGGGTDNREFQFSANPSNPAEYVTIRHNTVLNLTAGAALAVVGDTPYFATTFRFNDNIGSCGAYGFFTSSGSGTTGLNAFFQSYTYLNNAMILDGASAGTYPTTTVFPANPAACNFANYATGNYLITSGTLNNAGSDGTDIGADIGALNTAISGVAP